MTTLDELPTTAPVPAYLVTRFARGRLLLWLVLSTLAALLDHRVLVDLPRWVFGVWATWIALSALFVIALEYVVTQVRRPWFDALQACIDLPVIGLVTWHGGGMPSLLAPCLAIPMASAIGWLPRAPAIVVAVATQLTMLTVGILVASGTYVPAPFGSSAESQPSSTFLLMVLAVQAAALVTIGFLQAAAVGAARDRRDRWQRLFDGAPDSIFLLDRHANVVRMNAAARRITGYSDAQMRAGRLARFTAAEDRDLAISQVTRTLAGENTSYEARGVRADGTIANVLVSNAPLVENGVVTGVLSIVHDLTGTRRAEEERRQMGQSLDQHRRLLQSIVSTVPTYLYVFDVRVGRVTFANDVLLQMLGYSLEQIGIMPRAQILAFHHPDDVREMRRIAHRLRDAGNEKLELTYRLKSHDGSWRWLSDRVTVFERDADGTVTRILGSAIDVTEQRRLEADIRQSQKMEAVGTLAGGIAHDFNNILASVIGYTELAMLDAESDELQGDLRQVLTAAARGRQMVQRILAFSRRSSEDSVAVALEPIVTETLRLLLPTLPPGVTIDFHDEEPVPAILGDPGQMHQVVLNLCANAIYAMRDIGGTLTVRLQNSDLLGQRAVLLEVSDTGVGMTPSVLERAIDPFFTTKPPDEGTGMGLAMVHGIITGMGGTVQLESAPNCGTKATIQLPADLGRPTPSTARRAVGAIPTGTERIMVVDDEPSVATFLSSALARFGYRTTTFTSAGAAIEHLDNDTELYDLIITDMTMPMMSGEDLLREARRLRPQVPVVICTGFSASMTAERAYSLGASGYLSKPLSVNELALQVRRILDADTANASVQP